MDEDQLYLRPGNPARYEERHPTRSELELIMWQIAKLRRDLARARCGGDRRHRDVVAIRCGMQLELTDEEAAALLALLNRTIENDRYPPVTANSGDARHSGEAARRPTGTAAGPTAANGPATPCMTSALSRPPMRLIAAVWRASSSGASVPLDVADERPVHRLPERPHRVTRLWRTRRRPQTCSGQTVAGPRQGRVGAEVLRRGAALGYLS